MKFTINLLLKILYKRGLKNFFFELYDLFFVDFKYKTKTYIRNNNLKNNYVPYYTYIFKKNIKKLKKIIPFKNTYFIDLGCGKGRMLLSSSEIGFEKIIGIEKDNKLFSECKKNITNNNVKKKIKLLNQDFNKIKISIPSKKNLIFFWYGSANKHILKKIISEYKKKFDNKNIFFYIIPDKDVPKDRGVKVIYHFKDFKHDKTRNCKIIALK